MELRPYQAEAKAAVFEQWDKGTLKTLLVLPTGCGKTIVFAKVAEDCVRQGYRVLILAHRGSWYRLRIRSRRARTWDVRQKKQSRPVWGAGSGSQ